MNLTNMGRISLGRFSNFPTNEPTSVKIGNINLVVTRYRDDEVSVLFGKCKHGNICNTVGEVKNGVLICPINKCKFRVDSGIRESGNCEDLKKFSHQVKFDYILVDPDEIITWYETTQSLYATSSFAIHD